jgi:hypothetical protein
MARSTEHHSDDVYGNEVTVRKEKLVKLLRSFVLRGKYYVRVKLLVMHQFVSDCR